MKQGFLGVTILFNIVWGCTKVSPGCAHCYAETLSDRWGWDVWGPGKPRRTWPHNSKHWKEPETWNKEAIEAHERRRCFCGSMCDWAEDEVPKEELDYLWPLIKKTPFLDWLLLTKRPEDMSKRLPTDWWEFKEYEGQPIPIRYPNVWLGTSIENKDYIWRAEELIKVPAIVHFISAEPLLGSLKELPLTHLEWCIVGGESGADFREMNMEWARELQVMCAKAKIAYFFKQSSGRFSGMNPYLDEKTYHEFPR